MPSSTASSRCPDGRPCRPGQRRRRCSARRSPTATPPQETPAAALVDQLWVGADNPVPLPGGTDSSRATTAQLASTVYVCPDSGGAGLPPGGAGVVDATTLPDGFTPPADPVARAAVGYALAQLGKPYVWGGTGPDGFDCSGLMLASWAAAGVALPAGTVSQKHAGTSVRIADIAPGDLVFIPGSLGSTGNPRHNGMYVGHGLVVNAYDTTRGVVLQPLAEWAEQVTHIRRVHTPTPAPAGPPAPAATAAGATP